MNFRVVIRKILDPPKNEKDFFHIRRNELGPASAGGWELGGRYLVFEYFTANQYQNSVPYYFGIVIPAEPNNPQNTITQVLAGIAAVFESFIESRHSHI